MEEQIIVNGLLTSYSFIKNDNAKNVVVFLHGWASSKKVWAPAMNYLSDHGVSAYALDLPGFGKTVLPPSAWAVNDYVDFVSSFMVKLNISSAVVVGHSFGGRVAMVLAATRPELVDKLVVVDGAGVRTSSNFKKFLASISKIVKPFFRWRWTSPIRKKIYKSIGAEDYVNTPELQATFIKVIGEDLTKYLSLIKQKVLIIWGKYDVVTPITFAHHFLKYLPNSRLEVLDKAGHYSFLDKSEEFNKLLADFV